jgi:hypothetical protein
MLVVETIAKIRLAYFSRKMTIKAICRDLRVSRKVVRKVIRSQATEFHYQRDVQPQPKIGPWRERLDTLLLENDGKPTRERLTLIRVFEELRALGYEGGYDAVRRYARVWSKERASATASAYGSMWVHVRNDGKAQSSDAWALAGDLVYVFENVEGPGAVVDVDQMYVPVGLVVGSQENLVMATEAMMKSVSYEARRVIAVHEERLKDWFPSRITADGLRISEICLGDGEKSRVR